MFHGKLLTNGFLVTPNLRQRSRSSCKIGSSSKSVKNKKPWLCQNFGAGQGNQAGVFIAEGGAGRLKRLVSRAVKLTPGRKFALKEGLGNRFKLAAMALQPPPQAKNRLSVGTSFLASVHL